MTISLKKSCDRGEIFMTKWPVDGSVADRPEGVLQNERDNLGWPWVACLRHVRNIVFYESLSE